MLVYFALILVVLLGFCGLAIDVGRVELRTTQLQAAADAGALAAAGELMHSTTGSNYQTAATNDVTAYLNANGIPATGSGSPTVATQIGPNYGPYVNDYSAVQVTITQSFTTLFLGVLQQANSSIQLSVKSVAEVPPCLFFMGNPTTGNYGYNIASAGMDNAAYYSCPIYSPYGISIDYFAHISGTEIRTLASATSSYISGWTSVTPIYGVPPLTDPLAYVTAPTAGSCINPMPVVKLLQPSSTTVALTPGTYCGKTVAGVTSPAYDVEGSYATSPVQGYPTGGNCLSSPTVTFAPGLYVFLGGVTFNCATVTGTGVTMYFTKNSTINYGVMKFTSTMWNVSAPTDTSAGGIPGIAVMNDRAWIGGIQDFQWTYSTWYADGVVYLTGTGVNGYALAMSAPNYLNLDVANMYTYDAEVRPSNNYANLPAGNPLHTYVTLVQ